MSRVIPDLLPPAHLSAQDAVDTLVDVLSLGDPREVLNQAYVLGYQAAVLDAQARAVEHGANGGGKRSPAQQQQTARLNGHDTTTIRQAPGSPWTADEDAAVLRGEFPEIHTRGACYARRSRLRRQGCNL